MGSTGIIILAAGASARFEGIKQLSFYRDKTFIRHALLEAGQVEMKLVVVLGANREAVQAEIEDLGHRIVFNSQWDEGMASSISCGLTALLESNPNIESAIFMVCDQPYVSAGLLKELIAKYEKTEKQIVASAYLDTLGTPVLFSKTFFPVLLALKGRSGAKKIIAENMEKATSIPFPMGHVDIDTREDYEALKKNESNY